MTRRRRNLRGTKITGDWWTKQSDGREGKRCEITGAGGMRGFPGTSTYIFDVQECARVCKSHFFDEDTKRFFQSKISDAAYHDGRGGAYFYTSEKGPNMIRAYTVRRYDPESCGVETVGHFQQYKTGTQAKSAAKRIAIENAPRTPDAADIETVAQDLDIQARAAARHGNKEGARKFRAQAAELRRQKFELSRRRRRRRR